MQGFLTQHTNILALETEKFASQKDKIYFTYKISKYSNTSSICRFVNYALLTFSANPNIKNLPSPEKGKQVIEHGSLYACFSSLS